MIVRVEPRDRAKHKLHLSDMFKLRARVFRDELGWNVDVHNGKEYDPYDAEQNVYLLSLNQQRALDGALRLMPTTGPTLLSPVFSELVPGNLALRSPLLWEASRFCVCPSNSPLHKGIAIAAWHLAIAAAELAVEAGFDALVMICDERVKRLCRVMGMPLEDISFRRDENGTVFFGLMETTPETVRRIRDRGEIHYDVSALRLDSLAA